MFPLRLRNIKDYFISLLGCWLILLPLQEYEREMRSYEIPVREFNIEDPPDYGDVLKPTEVPVLPRKVKSPEKEALKSFEQLDDLDDDVEMVTKEDPMLSAFASTDKRKVKRTLSTESLDSELGSPGYYQKSKKSQKTEKKNIRKIKRRVSSQSQVLELHNSPRQDSHLSLVELQRGSALIGRELYSVATPAILCHKEPARASTAPRWIFMA